MINLSRKQWGGALVVSLLALSLALAGCSEPEVEGSDITGTWTYTESNGSSGSTTYTYVFASDGSATYTDSSMTGVEFTGSWSLNGTTVDLTVSGTPTGSTAYTITETYEVLSTSAGDRLTLTSGSATYGSTTMTYTSSVIGRQLEKQ